MCSVTFASTSCPDQVNSCDIRKIRIRIGHLQTCYFCPSLSFLLSRYLSLYVPICFAWLYALGFLLFVILV